MELNPDFDDGLSSPEQANPFAVVGSTTNNFDTMSGELSLVAVSDKPWSNFSAGDYTIEQWRRACLLKMPGGDPEAKSTYKLPVREPSGALNRNGVHAAAAALAGARGGVNAPASAKAAAKSKLRGLYRQLGEDPPESLAGGGDEEAAGNDSLVAVNTHDGPGWLTNPRDSQRLRNYWTKGPGRAKIGWGVPGDFNRCRAQLGKYVHNPEWLAGTCANLHFVALGFWPGGETGYRNRRGALTAADVPDDAHTRLIYDAFHPEEEDLETATLPPLEWFQDPAFSAPTPLTADGDHVYGHLATWDTCHVGVEGSCTTAPHSLRDYAYFRTGLAQTADGAVPVGQITMDTGHAERHLGPSDTVRHYDDTGTVVADVAAGEDEHGIWINGQIRPGVTDDQRHALQAGALSGDWRRIAGNLELVAALVVNVPGFPIPRVEMVASADEEPLTLVAAAIVVADPNAVIADRVATLVVGRMYAEDERRKRAKALRDEIHARRVKALVAAAGS